MLRVTPADGRPPFTTEIAPQKGAMMRPIDVFLLFCDIPLIIPILVDATLGYGWGWPERLDVVFPNNGAPYLANSIRR